MGEFDEALCACFCWHSNKSQTWVRHHQGFHSHYLLSIIFLIHPSLLFFFPALFWPSHQSFPNFSYPSLFTSYSWCQFSSYFPVFLRFSLLQDGAFLIRHSSAQSTRQPYTLAVLYQQKVYNIPIRFLEETRVYALGKEGKKNEEVRVRH